MGVRLVKYGLFNGAGTYNHNELLNRDLPDQHPISAITGLEDRLKTVTGLEETIDTSSLILEYNKTTKTLSGNVRLFESEDNAIEEKITGLFVDKYPEIDVQDTESIRLNVEGKGETLDDMFTNGHVFSHNGGTKDVYSKTEANAWYYDENLGSFVQPKNTDTFTGYVSSSRYRTYTHRATLESSGSDNDANGLVIAYVKDEDGIPHTLSCIINKGGKASSSHSGKFTYAIVYNRALSGEEIVIQGPLSNGHNTNDWAGNYITMQVTKAANAVECAISDWNSYEINPNTVISINLNDYEWGYYFKERVRYGYCNQSQPKSYFTNIYFRGKGPLTAQAIISPEEGNGLEIRDTGLYCSGGSGGSSNSNIIKVQQDNHGFTFGDVVYLKSDGLYALSFAEDSERIETIGVVTTINDENSFSITIGGEYQTDLYDTYPDGTVLYLSDDTNRVGALIDNPSDCIKPIAIKISTGILINIQRANMNTNISGDIIYYTNEEVSNAIQKLWT